MNEMNNEIINNKIEAFVFDEITIKDALLHREEFLKKFPTDQLINLTKENYAQGKGKQDTFTYILERKLSPLGEIRGHFASSFGVYFGKEGKDIEKKWRWTAWTHEDFDNIKQELIDLISAGKAKDYEKIDKNKLSTMLKGKILATYFPDDYLPVFSFEHIKYFLKQFGELNYQNSVEKSKARLLEIKNNYDKIKEWDNQKFMYFLYSPLFDVKNKSKKEIDEETPEIVGKELKIINDLKEYFPKEKTKSTHNASPYKPDYEKVAKNKKDIGEAGENAVLEYEKKRLRKANREDLAIKVVQISKVDDSQGYDIISYDEKTNNEIHIEVKTTKNDDADNMSFYLTDNEYHRLRDDEFCNIYYVFGVYKKIPKVRIIDKEKLLNDFNNLANAVLYKIDCELK